MKNLVKLLFIIILTGYIGGTLISSCSEETICPGRPTMNCYIYKINASKAVNDSIDSLTVAAFGTDSIILNKAKKVHSMFLPLRYTKDSTIFVLHYSKTLRDTIIIEHHNTSKFISMDCGYQMQQKITVVSYSKHKLDSIHISNEEANTSQTENLKLFY